MKVTEPIKIDHRKMAQVARYWDTHSFADVWDKTTPVKLKVSKNLKFSYMVTLDSKESKTIDKIASNQKTDSFSLIQSWVQEKLHQFAV